MSELALYIKDDGLGNTITIPCAEETNNADYVTVRTQDGVHHAFSASGKYYYGDSLVPRYNTLPTLTTAQIGGQVTISFTENGTYTTGYKYVSATIPMGYYLVQGYLDLTPVSNNQTIELGLSFETTLINSAYSQYHKFESTSRVYLQFNYYVNHENNYFIFYSNSTVYVTKGKCTFIRIALCLFKIHDSSRYCFSIPSEVQEYSRIIINIF